jgi:hypothetical protein
MPDNDLQLTFGADASGVTEGVGQAMAAVGDFGQRINALGQSLGALGTQAKKGLEGVQGIATGLQAAGTAGANGLASVAKAADTLARGIEERAREAQKGATEQLGADKAVFAEKIAALQLAAEAGQISRTQESAQIAALHQKEIQDQLATADAIYQIQQGALEKKLALHAQGTAAYASILDQEASLAAREIAEVTRLTADGLRQQDNDRRADLAKLKQEWDSAINPLVSSFTSGLLKMAEGTQSFAQTMRTIGGQIANDFVSRVIDPMIEKWLWKEGQQLLATITGAAQKNTATTASLAAGAAADASASTAQKAVNATTAFSGAVAAISPIPFIGPQLAPGIAAEMAALASAAGGFDIPSGVNPLTQLHAKEMVLPARLANPMRSMMDDYAATRAASGWGGPAQASGGDTHVHNYNVSALDAASFQTFLRGNKNPLSTVLQEMGRAGMRTA